MTVSPRLKSLANRFQFVALNSRRKERVLQRKRERCCSPLGPDIMEKVSSSGFKGRCDDLGSSSLGPYGSMRKFVGGDKFSCVAFRTMVEILSGGSVVAKAFLRVMGMSAMRVGPVQVPTPPVIR